MARITDFPLQSVSWRKKNKSWAEKCVRFASGQTILDSSLIRKTVAHKKINYDLFSGKLNMNDLEKIINPFGLDDGMEKKKIQHYPIMNTKLMLLLGEEESERFDFKVTITNPNTLNQMDLEKRDQILQQLQQTVEQYALDKDKYEQKMLELQKYYTYNYRDFREIRANCLVEHYFKELNMRKIFNSGFADALCNNEEIYKCSIVNNEPTLERLDPCKVRIYKSGFTNRVEDADMVVIEDYWSPGRILDVYGQPNEYNDGLTAAQVRKIEDYSNKFRSNGDAAFDTRDSFIWGDYAELVRDYVLDDNNGVWLSFADGVSSNNLPYDIAGNIRVLLVYWKSMRKISKIKYYDELTGQEMYKLMPEDYIADKELGEEVLYYFLNEAWLGVMIGAGEDAIIINCRPCPIQYNTITNPSKCHFGIIGTIYNFNDNKPYSMVDMMKPYNYLYDVTHDKLVQILSRNYGKIIQLNQSLKPPSWDIDKWLYYIKANGIMLVDPFNEAVRGKSAGMYNVAPTLDLEMGNSIQSMILILEWTKQEIGDIVGISRLREGSIGTRETVGGVERANLLSSHTTRWYMTNHQDTMLRTMLCFIETAKIAMRGHQNMKLEYITPEYTNVLVDIDGDLFAESDYGIVIEGGYDAAAMKQSVELIAQAMAQNGAMKFSTYLKLLRDSSITQKIKMVEQDEAAMEQLQQQLQQQQQLMQQQLILAQQQEKQLENDLKNMLNQRDNDTKIFIALLNADNEVSLKNMDLNNVEELPIDHQPEELAEKLRLFDEKLQLEKQKLDLKSNVDNQKLSIDRERNLIQKINKQKNTNKS